MTGLPADFSHAFPPALARFGRTLGPASPEATPLPDLLAAGPKLPQGDRRAALSLWSQYHLLALVPCASAAALTARWDLPLGLDGMAAVLTGSGHASRLCLPHRGDASSQACPARRLAPLLRSHLDPLADALRATGLPSLVFWSNAAAILAWSLRVIEAPTADRVTVWQMMVSPQWDGGPNPFRHVLGNDPAQRRICCLRFRLGCIGRCADCPVSRLRPTARGALP